MRRNTIFNCVKKLTSMFAGCAVLLLASCGSLVDSENSGSGSIRISVNEKVDARTAVADVTLSEFVKFTLTCDGVQKGSWQTTSEGLSAYAQMTTARIQLADGSHDFVLTAEDASGVTFKDSITKEISGDTILNFSLKLDTIPSEGTGSVKVTIDFTAIKDKAQMMYCMLYESGDETDYKNSAWLLSGPVPASIYGASSNKFTFTASNIPSGQHILQVSFYDKDVSYMVTGIWPELVTVLPGRESKSEYEIKSLSKVYNIKYYLDGADWGNNVYIGTSEVSLSTPTYNSDGYTFSGWYTAADYTGDTVEGWEPYTRTGDITLYGKLIPKTFNITYYNTDGTPFSGTHGEGAPATHTYGTDTVLKNTADSDDGLVFAGWYTGTRNDDGTVTLNSSKLNTLSASSWTTDIELFVKYARGVFHVSASGTDAAYVDDETAYGDGTEAHPFATVAKAVSTLIAQNMPADYRIVVHGELFERVTLDTSLTTGKANSLTIEGATSNSTDKLNGSASGTVLYIRTSVPVTLKNIAVTNGSIGSNYSGGGITLGYYNDSISCSLTLAEGALITGNKSTGYTTQSNYNVWNNFGYQYGGGGIFVTRGTLTIEDGAEISSNTGYVGGGIFVCGYSGTTSVVINGGTVKNNSATGSNTGSYASYYFLGGGGVYVYGKAGTVSFTMNGGEIKNNKVSYAATPSTGGGGIYVYNGGVTVNGGTISENSGYYGGGIHNRYGNVRLAGGTISSNISADGVGGAVYGNYAVSIKGSAYIPAGDDLKNDVFARLTVAGELTGGTEDSPVAVIKPSSYSEGTEVLTAADGVTLTQETADKFAVKSDGTFWNIVVDTESNNAVLKRPVYSISYKEKNGADLSVTLSDDAPVTHKYYVPTTLPVLTKEGYIFQGWYADAECKGEKLTAIEGDAITSDITLYTYWTKETLLFTIDKAGIELTPFEAEDGTVTITASDGFTGYSWKIDYKTPENAITGASVSADGKTLTFSKSNMVKGISYVILVTANDSGNIKQSATVSVKKQEAE